jgi:hypothetical protein
MALGIKAQTTDPLAGRADAIICDILHGIIPLSYFKNERFYCFDFVSVKRAQ